MAKTKAKPKKAMTGAERQAAYRQRCRQGRGGGEGKDLIELKAWITMEAFLSLGRQARHYSVTKRAMVERLIDDGHKKTFAKIKDTPAETAYWKTQKARYKPFTVRS